MKSAWILVVVFVLLAGSVWAQGVAGFSPRSTGMGSAQIGVADDAMAWIQNPAGLGALNVACEEGKMWANDAMVMYSDIFDFGPINIDGWAASWSGWKPENKMGFGAGIVDVDIAGKAYGAGFGANYKDSPLSYGINLLRVDPDIAAIPAKTLFNVGFMYRFEQTDKAPIRLGLTVSDVTDKIGDIIPALSGPYWSAGVAWPATENLLVAVDCVDITDEIDTMFNAGVEYTFGADREWVARIGAVDDPFPAYSDHDLTLGVGYVRNGWRVDVGWANGDILGQDTLSVSAATNF